MEGTIPRMNPTGPITVGITGVGYPEKRNIVDLPHEGVRFIRHRDPVQWADWLYFKSTGNLHPTLHALHNDLGFNRADVLHFFNKLSFSRTPWVSTFETRIPRIHQPGARYFNALARDSCKRLIAMSQRARRIEEALLDKHPNVKADVMSKMVVLHPAQRTLLASMAAKERSATNIQLVFVGHEFFRKGGLEVLRAVERAIMSGAPLHLTIVSSLLTGDYVSRSGPAEKQEALAIISRHPHHVVHHKQLPNPEVMALMNRSDVALLPTYHDSYGYSVLEGQALGCPVITTDVAALPEINDNLRGWMIEVPKDEFGEGRWRTPEARLLLSRTIEEQLTAHLEALVRDPDMIRKKGELALEGIRTHHDPSHRARVLDRIYAEAIGR